MIYFRGNVRAPRGRKVESIGGPFRKNGRFDKRAYQREYMRKRRAAQKAMK